MIINESERIFYEKGQIYWKWIHKIYSRRLIKPVHLIWMTDKSDNFIDKFVLTKTGQIVGAIDPTLLFQYLKEHKSEIPDPVNTFTWLHEVEELKTISETVYDITLIEGSLDKNEYTKASVYSCVDFINLFTDLACQLEDDTLHGIRDFRQIEELWNFGNNEIFWKEWGQEELPAVKIPPFKTNFKLLNKRMHLMIDAFLDRINILDNEKKVTQKERNSVALKVIRTKRYGKRTL